MTERDPKLTAAALLISVGGLLAIGTGIYFLVGDHPFHRAGVSEEWGMTQAQAEAAAPRAADWTRHVSDQVGAVSMGWGLFLVALALGPLRAGQAWAWTALWLGGLPTLLFASFGELEQFGTLDTGSVLSMAVFALFLVGMLLPARRFLAERRAATAARVGGPA